MGNKNVIFLHIDSLNYQRLFQSRCLPEADNAPFIRSILPECVQCSGLYSQAPFTEAAVKALMSGVNTLDDGGYLEGFSETPQILYEQLSQNGYDVYSNWYPNITPFSQRRGVTYPYYAVNYDFHTVWDYRLNYYREIHQSSGLKKEDMDLLARLMEDNFSEWKRFLIQLASEDKLTEIIRENGRHPSSPQKALHDLEIQIENYQADKTKYIHNLLDEGTSHVLFSIPVFQPNHKLHKENTQKVVQEKYLPFLQECYRFNRNHNLRNNLPSFPLIGHLLAQIIKKPGKESLMHLVRYFFNYKKCVWNDDLLYRIEGDYSNKSDSLSARGFLDHFLHWYDDVSDKKSPFFSYIQLSDFHYRESFFTYDTDDLQIIDQDFASLKEFYQKLPKSYRGALSSDFSLVYIDRCMQYFFDQLEKRGLLDHTAVILSSDHGFTFGYDPIRPTTLINFHEENYHVPFLLYDRSLKPREISGLHTTCDVPPTILDLCGIDKPTHFAGDSLLNPSASNELIHMEFMGSGCPDMERRPVMLAARNASFKAVFHGRLDHSFDEGEIYEIYCLENDPREMKNLNHKQRVYEDERLQPVLVALRQRFEELQNRRNRNKNN